MTNTTRHQLIAILLHELEAAGYPLGPAKYLQLQELLRQAPADLALEQWRGLLAPLFSSSPVEQEAFYARFDESLTLVHRLHREEPKPTPPPSPEIQKETLWRRIIYALAVVLLLVLIGWLMQFQSGTPCSIKLTRQLSITPGDTSSITLCLPSDTSKLLSANSGNWKGTPKEWQVSPKGGLFKVDSSGQAIYIARKNANIGSVDSMLISLEDAQCIARVYFIVNIINKNASKTNIISKTTINDSLMTELPLPYPQNDKAFASLLLDDQAQKFYEFYQHWQWPLRIFLMLFFGFLAWDIVRWDQIRHAKVIAELKRPDIPPYLWNPETGIDAADYLHSDAAPLLTRLRGRSLDERLRLDIAATVQSSIRAGGRIQLRYSRQTLPPDFLLLIDRHDAQDHRARLFEALHQVFLRAEAPVSRYFYDGDPRLCFDEVHPGGITLSELLHRHAGAQLLLVGEGQGLLSNLSGRVAPWTNLLKAWPRRALLLTRPMQAWGRREKELQALLPLLPASPAGLGTALDLFNAEDPTTLNPDLLKNIPDALQKPFEFEHELLPDLQWHFSAPYIDWVAACALWPTLHWDLTLYLGKVLAEMGTGNRQNAEGAGQARPLLLGFAGIRELTRLPWFVEGRIPDAARAILIEHLQVRGLEQTLRQALRELLQQAPPPPTEATAYDEYRMNLILNELFLRPDKAKKRELEREFERYLAAGKKPDFVALKLLDRPETPLDVQVGDGLKKYASKKGMIGLSWLTLSKLLVRWLVLMALGGGLFQPLDNPCTGEKIVYNAQTYCLKDERDHLLYLERLAADAILTQQHEKADSIIDFVLFPFDGVPERQEFYINTATRYYNFGAMLYNCVREKDTTCQKQFDLDSTVFTDITIYNEVLCNNFSKGNNLFKMVNKNVGLKYYQAMLRTCRTIDTSFNIPPIPDMVRVPAGSFAMGDQFGDSGKDSDELPVHTVSLAAFELGRYEVTFAEYDLFCEATKREKPSDESWGRGSRPVINVSWNDVVAYCNWLSEQHGYQPVYNITGNTVTANWNANGYRLPTEAEWECAARAGGKKVRFGNGKDIADPKEINFDGSKENKEKYSVVGEYREKIVPVGSLNSPNALGFHDMSGNVWEWCWDWYADYSAAAQTTPRGPSTGSNRVNRGGSWGSIPFLARVADRGNVSPGFRGYDIGFRLARQQ